MQSQHNTTEWTYETEWPKRKHGWSEPVAGFVRNKRGLVGKCPSDIAHSQAQAILNRAIPYFGERNSQDHPRRLYAVHDGVVYRAMPTRHGVSYHAFPEHHSRFPRSRAGQRLKQQLIAQARQLGCEAEVRRWMNW